MRIDSVHIKSEFKNLKGFFIDFDENQMETVLLGQNATGKSNFIEALILIFKSLDLQKEPPFDYHIKYFCRNNVISINVENNKPSFVVNSKNVIKSAFYKNKYEYLPKYVFTYYSGISNRLKDHFNDHQKRFYDKIIKAETTKGDVEELRRLFYVQLIHSYFVLMAYYSFEDDEKDSVNFLRDVLSIEDLESVLFVLKEPNWAKVKAVKDRFWKAAGLVREFLEKLWDLSIAPIYNDERKMIDFRRSETLERLYLYISNKEKLQSLASFYNDNTDFFKALESTYISDLIEEVRIKVKKRNINGEISFKELSEGEQQLLTVLGLLKFTKDEESLILLDEPDTHLNPIWKWQYLEYLGNVVKKPESTQIIINTHDPLVIGSLKKEQVRIFRVNKENGKVTTEQPDVDPKGLGVAGILTSELFGLPTILDKETQKDLNRKRYLQGKVIRQVITTEEYNEYQKLKAKLENHGFYEEVEDQWFKMYLAEMSKYEFTQKVEFTEEEKNEIKKISEQAVKDILEKSIHEEIT